MSVTVERDGSAVVVRIAMQIKRRAGRMEIIVPAGLSAAEPLPSKPQEPLVTALARAFHWQELIDSCNALHLSTVSGFVVARVASDHDVGGQGRRLQVTRAR